MNPTRASIFLLAAFCFAVRIVECQRQVFALIPLDGSAPGKPHKNKLANGVVLSNATVEDTTTTTTTIAVTSTGAISTEAPNQPPPLPNSAAAPVSPNATSSADTNVTAFVAVATPISINLTETTGPSLTFNISEVNLQNGTGQKVEPLPILPIVPTTGDNGPVRVANANVHGPKGVYVKTTASEKICAHHWDCYGLREPDEWCPLGESERFLDKGCFCDITRGLCTMQRLSETGAQFSDCAEKTTSACAGLSNNILKSRQH